MKSTSKGLSNTVLAIALILALPAVLIPKRPLSRAIKRALVVLFGVVAAPLVTLSAVWWVTLDITQVNPLRWTELGRVLLMLIPILGGLVGAMIAMQLEQIGDER